MNPPQITNRDPADLETGVDRQPTIKFDLLAGDVDLISSLTVVWINGVVVWENEAPVIWPGIKSTIIGGFHFEITAPGLVPPSTVLIVRVYGEDIDGLYVDESEYFTVAAADPLEPSGDIDFTTPGCKTLKAVVVDAWGQEEVQEVKFCVRESGAFDDIRCDAGARLSFPPVTREKDPILENKYLPIWDALLCQHWSIANDLRKLVDAQLAPREALKFMFQEIGLTYPGDIPGYTDVALRRLLDNADQVHSTRFTLVGLKFYLGLLIPNVDVSISGYNNGFFILCNSETLGFPDTTKILTAGTSTDVNNYLYGDVSVSTLTITITGTVSLAMQEFVRATIRQEIPYADDQVSPLPITVVFVP